MTKIRTFLDSTIIGRDSSSPRSYSARWKVNSGLLPMIPLSSQKSLSTVFWWCCELLPAQSGIRCLPFLFFPFPLAEFVYLYALLILWSPSWGLSISIPCKEQCPFSFFLNGWYGEDTWTSPQIFGGDCGIGTRSSWVWVLPYLRKKHLTCIIEQIPANQLRFCLFPVIFEENDIEHVLAIIPGNSSMFFLLFGKLFRQSARSNMKIDAL